MKKGKTMPAQTSPRARKHQPYVEGFEGAIIVEASVRLSSVRHETRSLRCRPGTFEWRYGRKSADSALYHAGIKFADLWERAGTAAAGSPDLGSAGGGQWKGIQDARLIAMQAIAEARREIGRAGTSRLVDYCVMGTSASEMAAKYNSEDRAMAHVLHEDLKACATAFGYL